MSSLHEILVCEDSVAIRRGKKVLKFFEYIQNLSDTRDTCKEIKNSQLADVSETLVNVICILSPAILAPLRY